ncbi:MAG: LysR family transcriptional regulator [Clostridiales bacterium]|nr:LysR family transcriptional regulator [Clostridiales bacterium]
MNITQLETFLKIAEKKNFTSAAGELGYAQSTVTTQIKLLEEELGTPLFDRLGKTIVLTSSGERLLPYAARLLQLEREIHLEVKGDDEPAGVLKVGVSESLCYKRLPPLLMEYQKRYPKVELRLRFITHDNISDLLKKGGIDLVYMLNPLIEDPDLTMLCKRRETLGFYCSPDHILAGKKKIKEKDLEGIPMLLTGHDCTFRHMLLSDLMKNGITPEISLETSSKEILKQFAANGLGVAFIPDMAVQDELERGSLVRLDWAGAEFPVFSQVLIHKDKNISAAIRGFVSPVSHYGQ